MRLCLILMISCSYIIYENVIWNQYWCLNAPKYYHFWYQHPKTIIILKVVGFPTVQIPELRVAVVCAHRSIVSQSQLLQIAPKTQKNRGALLPFISSFKRLKSVLTHTSHHMLTRVYFASHIIFVCEYVCIFQKVVHFFKSNFVCLKIFSSNGSILVQRLWHRRQWGGWPIQF